MGFSSDENQAQWEPNDNLVRCLDQNPNDNVRCPRAASRDRGHLDPMVVDPGALSYHRFKLGPFTGGIRAMGGNRAPRGGAAVIGFWERLG